MSAGRLFDRHGLLLQDQTAHSIVQTVRGDTPVARNVNATTVPRAIAWLEPASA